MGVPIGEPFNILSSPFLLLRFKGVFDYDGLYKMMHAWLVSKRYNFNEDKYKDKVSTPFGNEIEAKWTADKKITEFIKEAISIEFHLWDYSEVEIIKDGKKVKMGKARIEIKFFAYITLDYNKKFSKGSPLAQKLGRFYVDKIIYWDWRIRYANALEYSLYDLHTKVKKYLNMDTGNNAY